MPCGLGYCFIGLYFLDAMEVMVANTPTGRGSGCCHFNWRKYITCSLDLVMRQDGTGIYIGIEMVFLM